MSGVPAVYQRGLFYQKECYKNLTKARSLLRKREPLREVDPNIPQCTYEEGIIRPKRSLETDSVGRFAEYCWFCKENKVKRIRAGKRNKLEPVTVVKHPSVKKTLMDAAQKRNDQTLLRCISDIDLQQKGFKRHSSCYVEYTKICYERETVRIDKDEDTNESVRHR